MQFWNQLASLMVPNLNYSGTYCHPIYLLLDYAQTTPPAPAWKGVCSPKCPKAPSVVQSRGLSDSLKLLEQYVCGDACWHSIRWLLNTTPNNQQIQLWKPYLTTAVTKEMGLILGIGFDLIRAYVCLFVCLSGLTTSIITTWEPCKYAM